MDHIRLAINGFGRIGRVTFRALLKSKKIELVAVNDLADAATLAHLTKYDSVQGQFQGRIRARGDLLIVDGKKILALSDPRPEIMPWKELGIDVVIESTGEFTTREQAALHLQAGAQRVIISAPAKGPDDEVKFIVMGINDDILSRDDVIISNSSCTTNCVAPLIKILDEHWGIDEAFITTIHSYTRDQNLIDGPHKDLRRGRAAAYSIIPTTTGAAKASSRIFPHLKTNLGGAGIRVPVANGSLTDLTCTVQLPTSVKKINAAFKKASKGPLGRILQYTDDPIVSADVIGNPHSAIFDAGLTTVLGQRNDLVKVVAWYDNEAGYAARLVDLVEKWFSL
ncbi:MAG: type I glyceraldehyde-3-phosphate dehydrogenase [Bacteroidales bacterium]|nr:type I glyceraldehyde-3-phosphate dehydrogenase [Bacteroidales bacterium]